MSDCACLWSGDDGDPSEFFTRVWRKARKPYECYECRRAISPGETYEYCAGKWDGSISVYRTCVDCQDIRKSLYCDGWTFGQLWEDVTEQLFRETGLTLACIDKLATVEGKRFLQRKWMEYIEDAARG